MKKGVLTVALLVAALMGNTLVAQAGQENPTVTFNDKNTLEYTSFTEAEDGITTGNAFEGVLPGETRDLTITLENSNNHTADFYISATVMDTLEEAHNASGAVYDIELTADGNLLYDSTLGGYQSEGANGNTAGLSQMNDSLTGDIFIATLKKGETADVVLTIYFDGEAMGSTDSSDYSNALATLDFGFKASYEDSNEVKIVDKVVTRKGSTVYKKNIVEIVDNAVPLGVKTGDNTMALAGVVVLLLGILLFLLTGKKNGKNRAGMLVGALILTMVPTMDVEAENVYTVTFRPGNVGNFVLTEDELSEDVSVREKAELVAKKMEYTYDYKVTENGAIKVYVPAGEIMPEAPRYIVAQEGYFAKSATVWGPVVGEEVTKNCDYIVDYGKLVNGVEYIVRYLDSADDSPIAPMAVAYGNAGDEINVEAPDKIVISSATTYNRNGESAAKLILDPQEDAENVITFYYTAAPFGVVSENITYEDAAGDVVYVNEYVTVPGQAPQGGGAVLAPGQEETPVQQEETPQGEVVDIPDEEVPHGETTGQDDVIDIGEEEVPLAALIEEENSANSMYLWLGVVVALFVAVAVVWLRVGTRAKVEETSEE